MGSDGPEGGSAPGFRPSISFSRCRPAKQKVRSDSKATTTSKSSGKQASKEVSKKSNKSKPRRKSSSKPLLAVLSQQSDNRLEKLAKKVLNKPRRHSAGAEITSRKVGRPPIPSFTWSDNDDDDDIPGPVFSKKKDKSSTAPSQSNLVQVSDENNNNSDKLKSVEANNDINGSKGSTFNKEANPDNKKSDVTRQSALEFSSTDPPQQLSSTSADQNAQPTNEQLNQVIDQLYKEVSDTETRTVKQFYFVVQQKFHATLTVATKKYIKARVTDLINGEIVPAKIHAKTSRDVVPNATHGSQSNGITTASATAKTKVQPTASTQTTTAAAPTTARTTGLAPAPTKAKAPVLAPVVPAPAAAAAAAATSLPSYPIYAHNPHAYQYPYSAYPYYSPHYEGKWPAAYPPEYPPQPGYEGYSCAVPHQQQHGGQQQHQHYCSTSVPKQAPSSTAPATSRPSSSASEPNETIGARSNDRSCQLKHVPPIPSHVSLPPAPNTEKAKKPVREQSTQTERELQSNPTKKSQTIDKLYPKKTATTRATEGVRQGCKLCNKCPCHATKAPQKRASKRGVDSLRDDPSANYVVWDKQREKYTKAAEELEIQADRIRRDVKKRKREFLKEEAKSLKLDKFQSGQYRFLPGGQEMEDQMDSFKSVPVPGEDVKNARAKLFGDSCQPTLTQMFGVSRETEAKEAEEEETNVNVDASEQEKTGCDSELLEENTKCDDIVVLQSDDEVSSVVEMTAEDYLDDCSVKDEQLSIQRVEWRNGSFSTGSYSLDGNAKNDRSIWGSLVASVLERNAEANYECGFRRVFSDEPETPATEDAQGLEHLLGLFGTAPSPQPSPAKANMGVLTPSSSLSTPPAVSNELTQRGEMLAEKINGQVTADSPCLAKVEAACPQWRENVAFAMRQRDPAEIQAALDNIQQSKARLQRMKEGFLRAYEEQQSALGVFEFSLQESLGRFEEEGKPLMSAEESEAGQKVN